MLKELIHKEDWIPKGWKTTHQWAEEEGISPVTTLKYLREAVQKGIAERKSFKLIRSGVLRPIPHYKIKDSIKTKVP